MNPYLSCMIERRLRSCDNRLGSVSDDLTEKQFGPVDHRVLKKLFGGVLFHNFSKVHENHPVEPEVLRPGQDARLHFRVVFQRKDYTVGDECIPFLPATWNGRFRE